MATRWAIWLGAACLALASPAAAQTYPTALPLQGADAGDFEERLANILEFARPNQVTRFRLPSGRTVAVRSYQPAQISGSGPCRGYRVDLSGNGGFMAVDGFRCREINSNRWNLVEPETVLAQSGNPPRALGGQAPATQRGAGEPLYADDDTAIGPGGIPVDANGNPVGFETHSAARAPAPVPRRRPEPPRAVAALGATADNGAADGAAAIGAAPLGGALLGGSPSGTDAGAGTPLSAPTDTTADAPTDAPTGATADAPTGAPTGATGAPDALATSLPESTAGAIAADTRGREVAPGLATTADRTFLLSEPQEGEPAYVTQLRERIERARRLEAEVASVVANRAPPAALTGETPDRTTAIITPSLTPGANADDPFGGAPASTIYREPAAIAPALSSEVERAVAARSRADTTRPITDTATRVVGARQTDEILGYAADRRIVTALQALKYLSAGNRPSSAAVDSAVDEFATDERFALPIGNDALLARLNDARERSDGLPACSAGADALCVTTE